MQGLTFFIHDIEDHRRAQGTRYPFHAFISMIILANLNGYHGLNEMARFLKNNNAFFIKTFNLQRDVPGYTILRTFCMNLDFNAVNQAFYKWASQYINMDDWCSIDGKGLGSTSSDPFSAQQNFQSIVSLFAHETGIVIKSKGFENKKQSEIHCVQDLIKHLEQKGITLTLDAMHCQKKQLKPSWMVEMTM